MRVFWRSIPTAVTLICGCASDPIVGIWQHGTDILYVSDQDDGEYSATLDLGGDRILGGTVTKAARRAADDYVLELSDDWYENSFLRLECTVGHSTPTMDCTDDDGDDWRFDAVDEAPTEEDTYGY